MKYIILRNKRFLLRNKQHFYKQQQAEIGKKAKQHPEDDLSLFQNYSLSSSTLPFKNNR